MGPYLRKVSEELKKLIKSLLSLNPEARPTAAQAKEQLQHIFA
jgi:hypothetical protein